jgi:gliding motility-associated-like protein
MKKVINIKVIFGLLLITFISGNIFSQCINSFPNTQDFESAATWTAGGSNSDWAWGTPSKPVISGAGGGAKCWIIGGLSNTSYNGSQQSFIESPCYDFSSLSYPIISFKIFWETEYKYDGGSLYYSTNNGNSWVIIGGVNEPTSCGIENWFNYSTINYLNWAGQKQGWSGNSKPTDGSCQGGSGSLGWVTSKHCIHNLAGQSNVKFRFVFGSGTTCNSFDGFAIDDFTVENAQATLVSFTNTCTNFTGINPGCEIIGTYSWNFGDPLSGANNTSGLKDAVHIFSSPGNYNVSFTSAGPCMSTFTFTKTVSVLGSSFGSVSNVTCKGGNNGSATILPNFGNSGYTYTWSPEGGNASTASSLTAGSYSVTITDAIGCVNTNTITITEPDGNSGPSSQTVTACIGDQVQLIYNSPNVNEPMTYLWSPGSYTTPSIYISPSVTSTYSLNITVSGPCARLEQKFYNTIVVPRPVLSYANNVNKGCSPLCVNFSDLSTTETGSITKFEWYFNNNVSSDFANPKICFNSPGIYKGSHAVTNSFGCKTFSNNVITIEVLPSPTAQFTANNFHVTELNSHISFSNTSSTDAVFWEWNFGGMSSSVNKNPEYNFNAVGNYPVLLTVKNTEGCINTAEHLVEVLPEFTFFVPNSFTPNNDNLNDIFTPKGMGWDITSYKMEIYDRWGEKLFSTIDHSNGWDGKIKGNEVIENSVFVWKIELKDLNNELHKYIGTVTVLK